MTKYLSNQRYSDFNLEVDFHGLTKGLFHYETLLSKTQNETPNLQTWTDVKTLVIGFTQQEIFKGLRENISGLCPIKSADSSHLSLQGDVIVQPLEGIQQGLAGVWNFAWAEKKDRAICVRQI